MERSSTSSSIFYLHYARENTNWITPKMVKGEKERGRSVKWEVGSGKWKVGSGKFEVGSGKWEVGSGMWEVGSGK